jgi:coenzyme F420 hydrogenase subunit beta
VSEGFSDAAVVTTRDNSWNVNSSASKDIKEITGGAGTKYARAPPILKLGKSLRKMPRLAIVGTGCQIAGTRKLERKFLTEVPKADLTLIGLFCYENFPYSTLKKIIEEKFGLKLEDVTKTDITKGKMHVWTTDITCGSIGTDPGWTTVIVRSQRGLDLLESAEKKGYIEVSDKVDLEEVKKTAGFKKKKREKTLDERKTEGLFNPDYS